MVKSSKCEKEGKVKVASYCRSKPAKKTKPLKKRSKLTTKAASSSSARTKFPKNTGPKALLG